VTAAPTLVQQVEQHVEDAVEANQNGKHETRGFEIQLAKVKAQLALVEQQRVANLIALWSLGEDSTRGFCDSSGWTGPWDAMSREVVESLGLA
jgi:hypothetical protein